MDGSISFAGLLNGSIAEGGGGGSTVEITPVVTTGTKIADVSVNGVEKDLYCPTPPTPQEVVITPVVTTGTKIADVSVNGVEKDLYCPTPPTPTEVEVTQIQTSGTKIASIEVNNVNTDIYAPNVGGRDYSTNEKRSGTWINSKSIYQKTFNVNVNVGYNSQQIISISNYIDDIEDIINSEAFITIPNIGTTFLPYVLFNNDLIGYSTGYALDGSNIYITRGSSHGSWDGQGVLYVTLWYTKTNE